ncbi:MAG TPA: FGGY family carbohydrate kinase [Bacteroidales bacterium]|nr:FGGY family carbohydrate kinase [Bacteroidales bacterium]HNS46998.1 FGGY family carbohydrate kinase [Bacteroidales bacterium]
MKTLGLDIGSSFIKAAIYDVESGVCLARSQTPDQEMPIIAPQKGWAEQSPESWLEHAKAAIRHVILQAGNEAKGIRAIGITYQMHGLVCLDEAGAPLRPSIIWCDSRAVDTGNRIAEQLGNEYCRMHLLNSPGNFTASKLLWVMVNEPDLFRRIHRIMLPGDYLAFKLTGLMNTTVPGLSEGIFWDFKKESISDELLKKTGIQRELLPSVAPTFGQQGNLLPVLARNLGLKPGIPVTYRAGDQPNNAFSLNVLQPGEVAATAGTSGVVYAVTDRLISDPLSRINTFAHVNHRPDRPRLGVLLCINGTGILNSWIKKNIASGLDYEAMNARAALIPEGSDGLLVFPFGNGAERVLQNHDIGCSIHGINFNLHTPAHLFRASQEGIAFALNYGLEVMGELGLRPSAIRAGFANMFLSSVFRQALADVSGIPVHLFDTDGALGAAMGAAVGAGFVENTEVVFRKMNRLFQITPSRKKDTLEQAYNNWKNHLPPDLITV